MLIFFFGILKILERSPNVVTFSKVSIFSFPPQKKRTCGYSLRSTDSTIRYNMRIGITSIPTIFVKTCETQVKDLTTRSYIIITIILKYWNNSLIIVFF